MPHRTGIGSVSRRLSENARRARAHAATDGDAAQDFTAEAGIGDLFGKLRHMMEQITQAAGAMAQEGDGTGKGAGTGSRAGRVVFGYNVSMGLDGLRAEPFGDVPPAPAAPRSGRAGNARAPEPASRAPIVDVFEDEDSINVVAELPGVAEDDVGCTLAGLELSIETRGAHRYAKTLTLPGPVDAASLKQSCRNGILEVRLARVAAP